MRKILTAIAILAALVVGVGIGAGVGGSSVGGSDGGGRVTLAEETSPPPIETESSPAPAPVLRGTWAVTACDLLLFTQGESSTLVGSVEVHNTGTVDSKVSVSLKWDALPGPLFDGGTKSVELRPGQSREIRFTKKGLSLSDVDRIQASPGYRKGSDHLCIVKAHEEEA